MIVLQKYNIISVSDRSVTSHTFLYQNGEDFLKSVSNRLKNVILQNVCNIPSAFINKMIVIL